MEEPDELGLFLDGFGVERERDAVDCDGAVLEAFLVEVGDLEEQLDFAVFDVER